MTKAMADSKTPPEMAPEPSAAPARRHTTRTNPEITMYVSPADVREALRCSRSKAHQLVRQAGGVKIGGLLRVTVEDWSRFLERISERPRPGPRAYVPKNTPGGMRQRPLFPELQITSKTPLIPIRYRRGTGPDVAASPKVHHTMPGRPRQRRDGK